MPHLNLLRTSLARRLISASSLLAASRSASSAAWPASQSFCCALSRLANCRAPSSLIHSAICFLSGVVVSWAFRGETTRARKRPHDHNDEDTTRLLPHGGRDRGSRCMVAGTAGT